MASNSPRGYDDSESEDDNDFRPAPADLSPEPESPVQSPVQSRSDARRSSVSRDEDDADADDDEADVDTPPSNNRPDKERDGDEDEEEEEEEDGTTTTLKNTYDDDDDEEEEEEEDEDDEDMPRHRRKRSRRAGRNAFLDLEAEVDDEDEDGEDEKDDEEIAEFIDNAHPDDINDINNSVSDERYHRELDHRKEVESVQDAEALAKRFKKDYGKTKSSRGAFGESTVVPKRLLLPSVNDPSIWAVRCKEGKEREVIFSIMKKFEERQGTDEELAITAAFERGGTTSVMKGYVYVEAQRQTDILVALDGVLNVYPRTKMLLVEIKDMPDLLRVQQSPTLMPGAWVRIKKPAKYDGDLAQVIDITENGLEAKVKFIPRLDYGVRDEAMSADGKRKRMPGTRGPRPPQKLFSDVEARKRHPRNVTGNPSKGTWNYNGDDFENGFLVKELKIQHLVAKDVNPTLEEVTKFATSSGHDGTENLDLKALASSLRDSNVTAAYLPGDVVEVYKGEQNGLVGKATNVQGEIVTVTVTEGDLVGQSIEVPTRDLRKRFRQGEHVKVVSGSKYRDEVGLVVNIRGNEVTLLLDQSKAQITVFSRDLREADDIGGQGSLGQFELLDLVQVDMTTVGCIVKIDRESMVILNQDGYAKQILPSQISHVIPKRKLTVASDRNGSEIRHDDVVKEVGGQQRQGKIIHIHRSYVYLQNHESNENAGVFVTRASNLNTIAAKGGRIAPSTGPGALDQMNPALKLHPRENSNGMAPPKQSFGRDKIIGLTCTIKKGGYKGLLGIVKDTTDTHARVELHTKGKIVAVPKNDLVFKNSVTGKVIDPHGRGGFGARGGLGFGGRGGGFRSSDSGFPGGSRTPHIESGGERTPRWAGSSGATRTPRWSQTASSGSATPGWRDGSRTVNPYDGNRTAYGGGSGSRTPGWSAGSKTPAHDSFSLGSKTPGPYSGGGDAWNSGAKTPGYGMASAPTPAASGSDTWGASNAYDAPTPGAGFGGAPTPAPLDAPTPRVYSAPTPGLSALTPGGWGGSYDVAPTPAAAPTPGASGYYTAPTPAAMPETPGPSYVDED